MATSSTEICNLALVHLGQGEIASMTEASPEAKVMNRIYEYCRRKCLRDSPWQFATRVVTLAELADETDSVWSYVYAKPAGCIRIQGIIPESSTTQTVPYAVREEMIYTDMGEAELKFNYDIEDPNKFSDTFILALSHLLASVASKAITGDPADKTTNYQMYQQLIEKDKGVDAGESKEIPAVGLDFINARA